MSSETPNTNWSSYIQTPEILYQTRTLRFRDSRKQQFLDLLGFRDGMTILEVGCGPGAFCQALQRWLPKSHITGLDQDAAFIRFAVKKAAENHLNCDFVCGDATALQFPDVSFDATTSHTVIEHVPTEKFIREQYRVLKPGGIFTSLDVRSNLNSSEPWDNPSPEEKVLREKFDPVTKETDRKFKVAAYSMNDTQLGKQLEQTGFKDINLKYYTVA
ncbi:MAG: class I SAM-dependent methyltransferase, partial [Dehalococcoidales bacterium]|nr:class I SAM-dependent methyltransferase [Dehalococcoidales bacterium]